MDCYVSCPTFGIKLQKGVTLFCKKDIPNLNTYLLKINTWRRFLSRNLYENFGKLSMGQGALVASSERVAWRTLLKKATKSF